MSEEPERPEVLEQAPPIHVHSQSREQIVDRTGELLRAAVDFTADFRKADVVGITEPDTDTKALVIIDPNGNVSALPAEYFDEYRDAPKRIDGFASFTRLESFIAHVNRFKSASSALFAVENDPRPALYAIYDYHDKDQENGVVLPDFGLHRSGYRFPLSEEWKDWTADNGRKMTVPELAAFLEDRIVDVEQVEMKDLSEDAQRFVGITEGKIGTPTKLIELSRGLRIVETSIVADVRNINSGEGQISFQSEHQDSGGTQLNIPTVFVICIPVFQRSNDFYRIVCRLRYRKSNEGVVFWYELWRQDRVFEQAFTEAIENAQAETGLPLFIGRDETNLFITEM